MTPRNRAANLSGRLAALFVLALVSFAGAPAQAAEEILEYISDVQVRSDGSLLVEEIITVTAEGRSIRRGIFRDFPVRYRTSSGLQRAVGFKIVGITRNGQKEPYHTQTRGNIKRIYIGSRSKLVARGTHRYSIKYRTTRQLRYFKAFDEVYWNATGNFWRFPIRRAVAKITLPEGVKPLQSAGYTGRFGASGRDYRVVQETGNSITFETTRPLRRFEGLTVAVGFRKGAVPEPGWLARFFHRLWDNIGLVLLLLGAPLALIYYMSVWQAHGRDPERGVIIPLFHPPKNMSAGVMSYIHHWGFTNKKGSTPLAFVAALLSLAVRGELKIDENTKKKIILTRQKPQAAPAGLAGSVPQFRPNRIGPGEKVVLDKLLSREKIEFNKTNGPKIQSSIKKFKNAILREHEGIHFKDNYGSLVFGVAISLVALGIYVFLTWHPRGTLEPVLFVFASSLIAALLLFPGLSRLTGTHPGGGSRLWGLILTALGGLLLLPALLVPIATGGGIGFAAPLAAGALGFMNVAFFHLLKAPTTAGARLMEDIEGFKLYLSVAEKERLNMADAPDMSTELYERYLPYAIALGVEKPWSRAFAAHIARVKPGDAAGYHPHWYSGRSFDAGRLDTATSAIASSVAASAAAAMPSSSSSGSTGGGFSGGGGGGGGGGGW